ncbi:MAG TPA: enoyl-CoA hydratase/isomerase family protein [Thermoplasmata archaeon]|nr:enoyl-CoA hydratase/isomerase family protein [Thermoplasmata archaeon]
MGKNFYTLLRKIGNDKTVKAVVIRGIGKGFCGGGDVKEMYAARDKPGFLRDLTRAIRKCVIEIRAMEKPVIAAVNGAAFGAGFSLALACDLVIAAKKSEVQHSFHQHWSCTRMRNTVCYPACLVIIEHASSY